MIGIMGQRFSCAARDRHLGLTQRLHPPGRNQLLALPSVSYTHLIGAKIGNPDTPVISVSGDGGMQMNIQELATAVLEELPIICCIFNNEYLGMVRQWQKLFYGKRYAMTNLKAGALSRRTDGQEYPEYTPDFIRLAESYGAKGIRVTEKDQIAAAFEEAKKNTKTPTIIEFIIDPEEMVYPMVKPGGTLADLIMDCLLYTSCSVNAANNV